MKERYVFIDILKGIAILMIVYGHIIPGFIPAMTRYISTFHIPLFFFVSGLLFNDEKYKNKFGTFVRERTKGLVVPFLFFSIIVAAGYYFVEDNYREFICSLLKNGWGGCALWFVPILLLAELSYFPLSKVPPFYRLVLLVGMAVLSYLSSLLIGMTPYNVLLCFCGVWFYGIGNMFRAHIKRLSSLDVKQLGLITILGGAFSLIYLPLSSTLPDWFINKIPSIIYYISPLFATVCLIGLSILIERYLGKYFVWFFQTCGKQSFIILAFHQIICLIVQQYVSPKVTILIMIITLTFLVLFIPKYMPWMLGKKKN